MMSLRDKVVIVTGASSGIGRELATQLAARGASLVVAARGVDELEQTRIACASLGGQVIGMPTDVASQQSCQRLIDETIERFGRLDVLVNNAGISAYAPFERTTDLKLFERIMNVNYLGAVYCTHFALPQLKQQRGLIVAVSSLQGLTGFPGSSAYSASKHAMQGFFDSLRIELAADGVDVLVVSPGAVATQIHTRRLGPDGEMSVESLSRSNAAGMSAAECARQIVAAIERRRRELVMTSAGKLGRWLKLIAPAWTDRMVASAVRRFYHED
jgi:short-subunit dehydrogenase